mmetsp:Transcript_5009/g.18180  ORF Transcript_5009/g.18180 Transcript_5009/m.18180 type:complete len:246 (+) Transcript_5009:1102-1839(+)
MSSISKTFMGHLPLSSSASAPLTGLLNSILGSKRYEAVETGDHLACVFPSPFTAWHSSSISWCVASLARRISSCTGEMCASDSLTPFLTSNSFCEPRKLVNFSSVSGGNLDPSGSHCKQLLSTEPSFTRSVHLTFSSITMVFVSLALASLALKENRRGSARMGTRPKRWDRTSSCMMLVLLTMYTCSMAIVGTSDIRIRRSAFAMAGSMPMRSNSIVSSVMLVTAILTSFLNCSKLKELSTLAAA